MVSSEVQRTLVKSPPELWAEISDPESLARHLGEFGEIRITRVHPEQRVDWESDDARGTVAIKPSGWGTKVKLTVTRELAPPDQTPTHAPIASEAEPPPEAEAVSPPAAEPALPAERAYEGAEPAAHTDPELDSEPSAELELEAEHPLETLLEIERSTSEAKSAELSEPDLTDVALERAADVAPEREPQPRRGFFARLFGRRRSSDGAPRESVEHVELAQSTVDDETLAEPPTSADDETIAETAAETAPPLDLRSLDEPPAELASERAASPDASDETASDATPTVLEGTATEREPIATTDDPAEDAAEQRSADIAAEIRAAEEVAAEQVTAVLTGVLDRLGAAHHRPFSRS
jgi:hypothetical protein